MKNLKILSLVLCLTCVPVHVYASDEYKSAGAEDEVKVDASGVRRFAPFHGIFTPSDAALEKLYLGTLIGFNKVDDSVVPTARAVHANFREATREQMQEYRKYYFSKFFEFMDGLRKRNPVETADEEFNALYDDILTEANVALEKPLTEIKWLFSKLCFRAVCY